MPKTVHAVWGLKKGSVLHNEFFPSRAHARDTTLYILGYKPVKILVVEC
jgi:hypothetical protein